MVVAAMIGIILCGLDKKMSLLFQKTYYLLVYS